MLTTVLLVVAALVLTPLILLGIGYLTLEGLVRLQSTLTKINNRISNIKVETENIKRKEEKKDRI